MFVRFLLYIQYLLIQYDNILLKLSLISSNNFLSLDDISVLFIFNMTSLSTKRFNAVKILTCTDLVLFGSTF